MILRKQELKKFLIWMRNGTSFVVTWLLILLLAAGYTLGAVEITIAFLTKMVVLAAGGVFLFCASFTRLFLPRLSFLKRLSLFIISLCVYQAAGFYWLGLFGGRGTLLEWGAYALIILLFYLCCVAIYRLRYSKEGKAYTQALNEYQKKREMCHGE